MKCAFCKKDIGEEAKYYSIDISDHHQGRYASMLGCAACVRVLTQDGEKPLLHSTSRYSLRIRYVQERESIITSPLRDQCGPIWMFAKPQVDGLL